MKLAIIPARGGSKRIPGKNIKNFLEKPIISYPIEAAIGCGLFDEVMVSTDCDEIARVSISYGACIPFIRSEKNSDDDSATADVLLEVINDYLNQGKSFDLICCIYPTALFADAEKLRTAYRLLQSSGADALMPVVPFSYPPLRGLTIVNDYLEMKWPENEKTRSQDIEAIYHDSGQFYFLRTKAFLREKTLFCKKTIPMILSELEVQDVDNETDWKLAELKYLLSYSQV